MKKENLTFTLSDIEEAKLKKWVTTHKCNYPDRTSARKACGIDGGVITMSFTRTTLGDVVKCRCNACGKEEDITDYDSV